ncbi:hypothetical protein OAL43_02775 [bacterium]|nr:hypothetical protein [bacterium]
MSGKLFLVTATQYREKRDDYPSMWASCFALIFETSPGVSLPFAPVTYVLLIPDLTHPSDSCLVIF